MNNAVVATLFGTLGAVCWSVQLIPQIVLNYRRHSAHGLSAPFMMYKVLLISWLCKLADDRTGSGPVLACHSEYTISYRTST